MGERYDSKKHHRRSIRLSGYDYSQDGWYYVTICTEGKGDLFGEVVDGKLNQSVAGCMINETWSEMNRFYPEVRSGGDGTPPLPCRWEMSWGGSNL